MNKIPAADAGALRQAGIGALFFDMDGVIYRGRLAVPGASDLIANLQAHGIPFLFLTNNAALTPAQFQARLAQIGIHVAASAIFTSSLATGAWLRAALLQQSGPSARSATAYVVGEAGLCEAVAQAGLTIVSNWRQAAWVVAGLDRNATWYSLKDAVLAIRAGARFVAANRDVTLPSDEGELPGAGAIIAFLQAASGIAPIVIGKPERAMFEQALALTGVSPDAAVMVGDRLETDIIGAQRAGLRSIGVLTGVSTAADFVNAQHPPTWVLDSVADINRAWFGVQPPGIG